MGSAPKNTHRTTGWFELMIAEFNFFLGDWAEAVRHVPAPNSRHYGPTLAYWYTVRSMLALGRGDLATAAQDVDGLSRALRGSTEPQFVAPLGIFAAELARRRGDFEVARAAIDEALDQIEYCSDDFIRITALSAAGLRVEGDAGQVARDRRDPRPRSAAGIAPSGCSSASSWRPRSAAPSRLRSRRPPRRSTRARSATSRPSAGPPPRQPGRPCAGPTRSPTPAGAAPRRSPPRATATARPRRRRGARDRAHARQRLARRRARVARGAGAPAARRRGARRSRTATSAGEPEDPFGLTERERQVLELVAGGATNREIGEQLHMAEKTASVHVSRILGKLDVRSRTEAAAVAHRHGMAPTA